VSKPSQQAAELDLVAVHYFESRFFGHADRRQIILPGVPVRRDASVIAFCEECPGRETCQSAALKRGNGLDSNATLSFTHVFGGAPAHQNIALTDDYPKPVAEEAVDRRPPAADFLDHEVKVFEISGSNQFAIDGLELKSVW
jgi:hypothetical protein